MGDAENSFDSRRLRRRWLAGEGGDGSEVKVGLFRPGNGSEAEKTGNKTSDAKTGNKTSDATTGNKTSDATTGNKTNDAKTENKTSVANPPKS
jgi:hypothetical protein